MLLEETVQRCVVREFLDTPETGSGAHVIVADNGIGWFTLRLSDGDSSVTLDFPKGEESLRKLYRLDRALSDLRGKLLMR